MSTSSAQASPWRRRLVRLLIIAAVGVGVAVGAPRLTRRKPLQVKAVPVESGSVRDVVTSSTAGEIAPERRATVRGEIGARVTAVRKRRGDRCNRGDVVIALEDADFSARLHQARSALPALDAQLDQAKARVTTLERQAQRARLLVERGAGVAQVAEDAENLLLEARQGLRVQAALREQSEAAIRVASVALEKTRLTAPFDGLLVEVVPDPGEELTPGAPAFEIIDDTRLHVDASVDEADAARLAVGQDAALTLDALPGRRVPGRVARIAPALRRDSKGSRTLAIDVEVTDVKSALAAGLKPGMSANVEIVIAEKPAVAFLPTNVIVGRGVARPN